MMTMKKNEFMTKLADELKKRGVVDADDVAAGDHPKLCVNLRYGVE